jgi:hypothetical protein
MPRNALILETPHQALRDKTDRESDGRFRWIAQFGWRVGLTWISVPRLQVLVGWHVRGIGHAPFRRVIELAVSRSVLVTVSFPGRACHPLNA